MTIIVIGVLIMWFGLVCILGAGGSFATKPGAWPLPILIGVTAPLVVAMVAFQLSPVFRRMVARADLRLLTAMQAWRFAGIGLLALGTQQQLPGSFAWSAGWEISR